MTRNELYSARRKRTGAATLAPEPEWRENMRDLGLMLSGIYQDVRGDVATSFSEFIKWIAAGLRRAFSSRAD